jgi:hypothetical protein
MVKDPNAPRRPLTGYFRYANKIRLEIEREHKIKGIHSAKYISKRWKALNQEKKNEYNTLAQAEMFNWKIEMAEYKKTAEYLEFQLKKKKIKKVKFRKKPKDKNMPNRSPTGYFLYLKDVRSSIIEKQPELKSKVTEVGKLIGKMWSELSEYQKSKYLQQARLLKEEWKEKVKLKHKVSVFALVVDIRLFAD